MLEERKQRVLRCLSQSMHLALCVTSVQHQTRAEAVTLLMFRVRIPPSNDSSRDAEKQKTLSEFQIVPGKSFAGVENIST